MTDEPKSGADIVAAYLKDCVKADAAIVVDGSANETIARMLAEGWTWDGTAEVVAGKRIRVLVPPPEVAEQKGLHKGEEEAR